MGSLQDYIKNAQNEKILQAIKMDSKRKITENILFNPAYTNLMKSEPVSHSASSTTSLLDAISEKVFSEKDIVTNSKPIEMKLEPYDKYSQEELLEQMKLAEDRRIDLGIDPTNRLLDRDGFEVPIPANFEIPSSKKNFFKENKKTIIIVGSIIVAVVIGLVLYSKFKAK